YSPPARREYFYLTQADLAESKSPAGLPHLRSPCSPAPREGKIPQKACPPRFPLTKRAFFSSAACSRGSGGSDCIRPERGSIQQPRQKGPFWSRSTQASPLPLLLSPPPPPPAFVSAVLTHLSLLTDGWLAWSPAAPAVLHSSRQRQS